MRKVLKFWWLLLLVATFVLVYSPVHNHIHAQQLTTQMYGQQFTLAAQSPSSANVTGSGTQWYQISWNVIGSLSACQIRVDSSADGSAWNAGDIIPAQTCTSNGNFTATAVHTVNFVRLNPNASITGTGTLVVTLTGYQNFPGTTSPNNGVAGEIATYAAAGGSTSIGPDANITSNGTGTLSLGSSTNATTGILTVNGATSGSLNWTAQAAAATTWTTGSPVQSTASSGISMKQLRQNAATNFAGQCTMAATTTCTATIQAGYAAPLCFTNVNNAAPTTFQGSCALSGTTVTVTASAANSNTWNFMVMGNPN